jgi:hypothetical protein
VADAFGNRSRQIDVALFDESLCAPLVDNRSLAVLPAEALLCVIEVKSTLDDKEVGNAFLVANSLLSLRPYGRPFDRTRVGGAKAKAPRYFFTIFAYKTDLARDHWPTNEWNRVVRITSQLAIAPSVVDRVVVLDRGFISPPIAKFKKFPEGEEAKALHDWVVHLGNFLNREGSRRPGVDLQRYSPDERRGWQSLSAP